MNQAETTEQAVATLAVCLSWIANSSKGPLPRQLGLFAKDYHGVRTRRHKSLPRHLLTLCLEQAGGLLAAAVGLNAPQEDNSDRAAAMNHVRTTLQQHIVLPQSIIEAEVEPATDRVWFLDDDDIELSPNDKSFSPKAAKQEVGPDVVPSKEMMAISAQFLLIALTVTEICTADEKRRRRLRRGIDTAMVKLSAQLHRMQPCGEVPNSIPPSSNQHLSFEPMSDNNRTMKGVDTEDVVSLHSELESIVFEQLWRQSELGRWGSAAAEGDALSDMEEQFGVRLKCGPPPPAAVESSPVAFHVAPIEGSSPTSSTCSSPPAADPVLDGSTASWEAEASAHCMATPQRRRGPFMVDASPPPLRGSSQLQKTQPQKRRRSPLPIRNTAPVTSAPLATSTASSALPSYLLMSRRAPTTAAVVPTVVAPSMAPRSTYPSSLGGSGSRVVVHTSTLVNSILTRPAMKVNPPTECPATPEQQQRRQPTWGTEATTEPRIIMNATQPTAPPTMVGLASTHTAKATPLLFEDDEWM